MNIYYVYAYLRENSSVNGPAGSPYYIGKGKRNRAYQDHFDCAANKPKNKNFILKIFDHCSNDEAKFLETGLIKIFGRIDLKTGCLRNLTHGGDGSSGYKHTAATKTKLRKNAISRQYSIKTRQLMSGAHKGSKNHNFQKCIPEELIRKRVETRRKNNNYEASDKTKFRISQSLMGSKNPMFGTIKPKGSESPYAKAIKCTETNQIFGSITDAGKILEIPRSDISNVLTGHQKSTKGLHFEFI